MTEMFRDLNKEQQKAVALHGIDIGAVTIQVQTGHPRAAELMEIRNDFFGCVQKCRVFREIWDKVRRL
jgi:hypothetical protein